MSDTIKPGDRVYCVACEGKGYVSSGGALPVPVVCKACDGSGQQIVEGMQE